MAMLEVSLSFVLSRYRQAQDHEPRCEAHSHEDLIEVGGGEGAMVCSRLPHTIGSHASIGAEGAVLFDRGCDDTTCPHHVKVGA